MIRQCLSNKNESATVSKSKNFSDLNKSLHEAHMKEWLHNFQLILFFVLLNGISSTWTSDVWVRLNAGSLRYI